MNSVGLLIWRQGMDWYIGYTRVTTKTSAYEVRSQDTCLMKPATLSATSPEAAMQVLTAVVQPVLPASLGWLSRLESAVVAWQAKRLAEMPAERLWAQAMQDTRSFAEIRRAGR